MNIREMQSTYNALHSMLRNALRQSFDASGYSLYIRDVFVEHPTMGNSIIVRHYESGNLYHVMFTENGTASVTLDTTDKWVRVIQTYEVASDVTATTTEEGEEDDTLQEVCTVELMESESNSPLRLRMRLIERGFGNTRDNHYYSKGLLQESASKFVGAKMYLTEHIARETNVRNEVAQVLEAKYDNTVNGIVAIVGVFDPTFAENVRNRASFGILEGLKCSISASGSVYKEAFNKDGRKGRKVKEFTKVGNVALVTAAGAGGQGIAIV